MKGQSKVGKVFKTIGIVFLILIILLVLVIGVFFVIDKVDDAKSWDELKEAGYVNLVSVGSHNLNVCVKGNADAQYTIVSIAGLNSMANVVEMEPVADQLKDKYRFAFVDRSGYGLSDDTHEEQTVEQVVSDYRTALTNAGLKAPGSRASNNRGYTVFSPQRSGCSVFLFRAQDIPGGKILHWFFCYLPIC